MEISRPVGLFIIVLALIAVALVRLLVGDVASRVARKRNRNQGLWRANCILMGLPGLLLVAMWPSLRRDGDSGALRPDTLGSVAFLAGLAEVGALVWWCLAKLNPHAFAPLLTNIN